MIHIDSGDGGLKPKYVKIKQKEITKNFKFKMDMEFSSLEEFKDVILEHSILNEGD